MTTTSRTNTAAALPSLVPAQPRFADNDVHPYDQITWEHRDVVLTGKDDKVIFEQRGVEFPAFWSQNATTIVTQKYFRGNMNTPERESSLRQVIDRIVDTITAWGLEHDYYDLDGARVHNLDLKWLMLNQYLAFNSPVWFNIGVPGVDQQSSARFILNVEDDMRSILNWYVEEGLVFQRGSGAGVNLSKVRSRRETLAGGGTPSGPVSFMRGADASAGTISSGGKTRRAAKMVILDADHPDIEEFIWCKALEERKARDLEAAGWDMGVNGADIISVQYQNANNSVRITDELMEAVLADGDWDLTARTDGRVIETVKARQVLRMIAEASWECADPGVQFDSTIERWNTTPKVKLRASNPCSEHIRTDNSSCNLASLNLLKFLSDDGVFDTAGFTAACAATFLAQDILICGSDYPIEIIGETTRTYRDLGLGYANLGALLMAMGHGYDSDEGRTMAAAVTGLMTGAGYRTSARIAGAVAPFPAFAENRDGALGVMALHSDASNAIASTGIAAIDAVTAASNAIWVDVIDEASTYGLRNAQASLLAPTGTISFAMDCSTTGIEPSFSLVTYKSLVGGGYMQLVDTTVGRALRTLGYDEHAVKIIEDHVLENGTALGAPGLAAEHLPVFATAVGANVLSDRSHVEMMAAVQPLLGGAISKTANMPKESTVEDIEELILDVWRKGIKCLAIYRDGSKVGQPLKTTKHDDTAKAVGPDVDIDTLIAEHVEAALAKVGPTRERLSRQRTAKTTSFDVGGIEGYMTVGEYDDGRPGELFIKVSKQGSTLSGIMDGVAVAVSMGLQYGVPLADFVAKFTGTEFEPKGITSDPDLRIAKSLFDYIFRRLALDYLPRDTREIYGILSGAERTEALEDTPMSSAPAAAPPADKLGAHTGDLCNTCGGPMQQAGSCKACVSCGTTSGCS